MLTKFTNEQLNHFFLWDAVDQLLNPRSIQYLEKNHSFVYIDDRGEEKTLTITADPRLKIWFPKGIQQIYDLMPYLTTKKLRSLRVERLMHEYRYINSEISLNEFVQLSLKTQTMIGEEIDHFSRNVIRVGLSFHLRTLRDLIAEIRNKLLNSINIFRPEPEECNIHTQDLIMRSPISEAFRSNLIESFPKDIKDSRDALKKILENVISKILNVELKLLDDGIFFSLESE